jgi:hypothetical protein
MWIEEEQDVPSVRVYPNPSTGRVFVEFAEVPAETVSVEVYNTLGMRCAVQAERTSDQLVGLDLSSFGSGMYVIRVIKDGRLESYTVVIE